MIITRTKLSLLVNVLFWWEEEVSRWSPAENEKARLAEDVPPAYSEDDNLTRAMRVEQGTKVIKAVQKELPSERSAEE